MNNFSKKVSVIVPSYNHAAFLKDAVESVINQSYQNWECIISDDGSTDETPQIAHELVKADTRVKYVRKENGGLASARNFGINNATGDYILPLDADDKIDKTYLNKTVPILTQNPYLKLVFTDANQFGNATGILKFSPFTLEQLCYSNRLHCTALYKISDYNKTEGYRENMSFGYEDWDFWMQLLTDKNEIFHLSEPLFWVRVKSNSMHNFLVENQTKESIMRAQLKINNPAFFNKHIKKINPMLRFFQRLKNTFQN